MAGRTTIIISHDLHTVTDADEIVVLEGGAVSAVGRHEELLATSRIYAHLYALHHPANRITAAAAPPRVVPVTDRPAGPPPTRTRPRPRRGVLAAVVDVATTPIRMVPSAATARSRGPLSGSRASASPPVRSTAAVMEPRGALPRSRPSGPPLAKDVPAGPPAAAAATSPPPSQAAAWSGRPAAATTSPPLAKAVPERPPPAAATTSPSPSQAAASSGRPPVAATTPLRAATPGRHARQSPRDTPEPQRPSRHALAGAVPTGPLPAPPPPTMALRAIGSAPVTAPGLAHQLPGPRAPHDVPS
jgi:hypothetical protein